MNGSPLFPCKRICVWLLCALLSFNIAHAAIQTVDGLAIDASGEMKWHGVTFYTAHFTSDWKRVRQQHQRRSAGFPKADSRVWVSQGTLFPGAQNDTASAPILLKQEVTALGGNSVQLAYRAISEKGTPTREMFLQVEIPIEFGAGKSITLNGKTYPLPESFEQERLFSQNHSGKHTLTIPAAGGTITIEGRFGIVAQDQRARKQAIYALRLRFSPEDKILTRADLDLTLTFVPYASTPVSLREAANFGFRDEVAGDKIGGWTDQGADNDMRALPAGALTAAGVRFEIIDAASNAGRGALVFSRKADDFLGLSATVDVPGDPSWQSLYLLHGAAWLPGSGKAVGTVTVTYADGGQTRYEIQSGRDVGNWWSPMTLPNAAVGWSGENRSSRIGLYVSRIPLEGKPVRSVRLENEGPAMWMVAGISGSEDDIILLSESVPWEVKAGGEWTAHKHEIEIEEGSVFDFSRHMDAPAGKHGAVIITPEGRFAFADRPDERVRFWGVNLCFSANYLEKDEADRLAVRLARSGYNTIRIHHYDRQLGLKGGKSYELDPEQLDKLDYLFAAMKREGIYVSLDLYTSRVFTPEELVALGFASDTDSSVAGGDMHWRFKAALPVLEGGFETWAAFARNLLNHRNPYTGLTWKEDPALIGICPVNEDSPGERIDNDPFVKALFEKAFEKWWAQPENRKKAGDERTAAFNWFVYEMHRDLDAKIYTFLKEEMGVTTPLTGSNHRNVQNLAFSRQTYDFVDNHQYWDHPKFPQQRFRLPYSFNQGSATAAAAPLPRSMMPTRIIGKPFAVTEFNFVRPNLFRAEGGVLMPAYASLQDWDAIYNFEYASSSNTVREPSASGGFSVASDPIGMLADRLSALLFLRGDIAPASGMIGFEVHPQSVFANRYRNFPESFNRLGLVTRIGSGVAEENAPAFESDSVRAVVVNPEDADKREGAYAADTELLGKLKANGIIAVDAIDETGGIYRGETGQIELNTAKGSAKVVTGLSELFVLPANEAIDGSFASVRNGGTFGTVSVISADDLPLEQSNRLLVVHLTNALPAGMRFADSDARMLIANGGLPHLLQRGSARITLNLANEADWKAWSVTPSGKRIREIPLKKNAGGWQLHAQTVSGEDTQMAYEIVRQ